MIRKTFFSALGLLVLIAIMYCMLNFWSMITYEGMLDPQAMFFAFGLSIAVLLCAYAGYLTRAFLVTLMVMWMIPVALCVWAFVHSINISNYYEWNVWVFAIPAAAIAAICAILASRSVKQTVGRQELGKADAMSLG